MKRELRIAELQFAVEFALEKTQYKGQSSARVQTVPDTRAIRYYTTLGILARPAVMKGRTAFYDKQHVLQLVAIKRLQAQGETLGDIQQQLTGLSNRRLGGIAKLPAGFWDSLEKQLSKNPVKASAKPATQDFVLKRADASKVVHEDSRRVEVLERADTDSKSQPRSKRKSKKQKSENRGEFWAAAASIGQHTDESLQPSAQVIVSNETRIDFPGDISIIVPIPAEEVTPQFIQKILPKVQELTSDIASVLRQDPGN